LNSSNDLVRRTQPEAAPANHAHHGKVKLGEGAEHRLQNVLGLQGDALQVVTDYHKNTVAAEMDKHKAHSATIHYIAHTEGSADPKMHITATLKDHKGKTIPSKYGNPEKEGQRHHIYTGQLPKELEDARQQRKEYLLKHPEEANKHKTKVDAKAQKQNEQDEVKKAKAAKAREEGLKKKALLDREKEARKAENKAHQTHGK